MGGNGTNSLKELRVKGLKELRDIGLKVLKVTGLKYLILKLKTEDVNIEDLDDLTRNREEVKKKIRKLLKEKKDIESRIEKAQKSETEKIEDISEFPWREEIFPPLPRKVQVKIFRPLDVKNGALHVIGPGVSEVKDGGLEIVVTGTVEKPDVKKYVNIKGKIDNTKETTIKSDTEGADPKSRTGKKDESKTLLEKEEKIKPVYPFSAGKVKENVVFSGNSSPISTEKGKTESKNNPSASIFGNDLIEELLNSDDLNPEEEQGFMKYLEEQKVEELIVDLKNVKALLVRAEHSG